jgi:cyclopropane-fatty-acyl-phospholipid synthase
MVEEALALADVKINGDRPSDIRVYDERFYERVISEGSLGLGEAYMEGWWDAPALDECIAKILRAKLREKVKPTWGMIWTYLKSKFLNMQSKGSRSKKVIDEHYELGNELYECTLGDTVCYSCAYWKGCNDLDAAQTCKFDLVARKVGLKPGMKVLDLGCGWGGFSKHIAKNYGVEVVAVNLSKKQCDYARKICEGLPVTVLNQDYRDTVGTFDRVLSVGFMEHVGSKNHRSFMTLVRNCLKDDGIALIHTIGSDTTITVGDPWITKYIFPHGHCPSPKEFAEAVEGLFVIEDWHNLGVNYERTLLAWYQNFEKNWDKIKSQYPDPFFKMWKYYLLGSAGAFRARDIQLWQVVLTKNGAAGGYESVR